MHRTIWSFRKEEESKPETEHHGQGRRSRVLQEVTFPLLCVCQHDRLSAKLAKRRLASGKRRTSGGLPPVE